MQKRSQYTPLVYGKKTTVYIIENKDNLSINQIIAREKLNFSGPVVCSVDRGFWLRRDWDCRLYAGAVVRLVELPRSGNLGSILAGIAIVVAAIYAPYALGLSGTLAGSLLGAGVAIAGSLLMATMYGQAKSSAAGSAATAYALSNCNRYRPNEPFAERFGRRAFYPDVAMSFTRHEGNEQYLYLLLVLGVGEYDNIIPTIGKTPLADYAGATYNIVAPGVAPTICPLVFWTSAEVSGQELDTDFITYVATPRGAQANFIEIDICFAGGLIRYNDEGKARSVGVSLAVQLRQIDDYGAAITEWTGASGGAVATSTAPAMTSLEAHASSVFSSAGSGYYYSGRTQNPLRYTEVIPVPYGPGRYEIRIRRVNASPGGQTVDKCAFTGLKSIGGNHPAVADATMIEAKIKATDQLSADSASKLLVEATRKLYPVTATGYGTTKTATRSIVDACAYLVTGQNCGRFDTSILAFDVLAEVKDSMAAKGYYYDAGLTDKVSVMDACTSAALCGSAVAYTPGGLFCLAEHEAQTALGVPFTDEDMDPDSFKITTTFKNQNSFTCIKIKYYDAATGQDEIIDCFESGGNTGNPKEITLDGCTSRQQAWEVGLLLYRDMMLSITTVEFTTGLKGNLPALFSWIPVASTAANWDQTGVIVSAPQAGEYWVSEPLDWGGESTGWIIFSGAKGELLGPYECAICEEAHKISATVDATINSIDAVGAGTKYIFGPASVSKNIIRVMGFTPSGRDKVAIIGQVVEPGIYATFGAAPAYGQIGLTSGALAFVGVAFVEYSNNLYYYKATWTGAATAYQIELNAGSGYTVLNGNLAGHTLAFSSPATAINVRITPYANEALDSAQALVASYAIAPAPTGLSVQVAESGVTAGWTAASGATSYQAEIWVDGAEKGGKDTTGTFITISSAELAAWGGPWAAFAVHVRAVFDGAMSADAVANVGVAALAAPSTPILQGKLSAAVILSWGEVAGATGYKVYVGTSSDFSPGSAGTLKYTGANTSATISVDLTTPYAHYFKVAATDAYHQLVGDLVFSAALAVVDAG